MEKICGFKAYFKKNDAICESKFKNKQIRGRAVW